MKVNESYSEQQIASSGMIEKDIKDLSARIFTKKNKVYFFENLNNHHLRLYSVISKRSFFL